MHQKAKIHSLALLCVAAVVIATSVIYRRRRRRSAVGRLCCSEFDEKPQNQFKRVLADNSYSGFKHYKREGKEKESSLKVHPYEEEITFLLENPPAPTQFATCDDKPSMDESYVWVSTENQLESLASLLSKEKVFAVDTEQHSVRSFHGFTALMQVSTQKEDFLLDTIALHDVMSILRPVFANPSICKVFHGADNDVIWLQRDFHIYVVNMFDTAKACEVLLKPQKSLAYLLDTYCGVSTDKTFQREDWRLRPLSVEMIQYARTDAHYLLYIADRLVSELTNDNPVSPDDEYSSFFEATRRSNMVCMQLYAKEVKSNPGASAAASIYSRMQNQELTPVKKSEIEERLWKLCAWRDLMARLHDESLSYVLSDQAIAALATKVPKDPVELFNAIQEADLYTDSLTIASAIPTPSHIVSTHVDELCFLLHEVDINININDILKKYLHMHLSPTGCCPMSIYNYALLSGFSLKRTNTSFSKQNGRRLNAPVSKKATRELFVQKFSCKSPVYHNCRIYANDGRLLCYCDRRKLEWYLKRELASVIEDDPPAIMLLFEPKGRPEDEGNDFYIHSKRNICVGCGEKNHYLRYRIIPSCYRMHFPEHLKSHRSHDIVLLCVDCHEIAHSAAEKYKRKVAAEFKIPLFVRKIIDTSENETDNLRSNSADGVEENGVSPLHLRTAAMALLRHGTSMPTKRRDELMQIVKKYFGGREISQEDLEMALLVGMSPHEIRRLEKKKGLKLKHTQTESFRLLEKNSCVQANVNDDDDLNNGAHNMNRSSEDDDVNNDITNGETDLISNHDNECEITLQENGETDAAFKSNQRHSSKNAKKFSLLGHGPHGKQVVDQILKSNGEEGISQFCRKWRQVFVEAVNPQFLPSGWDVLHSGRRDFGDFSVYNPAKKASEALFS